MENITLSPMSMTPLNGSTMPANTEIFIPKGVCAKQINFSVAGTKLEFVSFTGGCDGNLKGISSLVEGMEVAEVINRLSGITCGKKATSCPDQLCKALQEYIDAE